MATGFGAGFDMSKLIDNIEQADKKLKQLSDTNEKVAQSISNTWKGISSQGLESYIRNLEKQRTVLNDIASIKFDDKSPKILAEYGINAQKSIDEINKLIYSLTQLQKNQIAQKTSSQLLSGNTDYFRYEEQRRNDNLETYRKNKESQAKIDANYHNQRQRELEGTFAAEDKREKERYESWLLKKQSEINEVKRIEDAKTKATIEAIQKQNEAYAKIQKYKDDNQKVKDNTTKARQAYEEQIRAYTKLFDEAIAKEKKQQDDVRKYEQQKYQESLDKYRQTKREQESVDKHYHNQRQREYEEMFRRIDEIAKKESQARARNYDRTMATGDTTQHALNSYNRLMGDKGLFNLNNAQRVISQLEQAQAKVNLRTQEGQRAYANLGNAINAVRGRMREYGAQTDALRNKHQGLMDISGQLARRLALVFSVSQVTNYAKKIISVRKEFELQHRSLQILIQDQDKANDIWNQTVALALKSPFRVRELVTYTKQLAAYRIETEKLHDTTRMLADVSAGLGVDMSRLILAYGQIKAANFLRGTELRQLTEAGIPMLDELAKHFNDMNKTALTSADVFEMISKRMVTFKDVEAVFKRITSEGGVFYKMQEQQAETLYGMISNLGDSIDLMMNSIGQSNDSILKDTVSSIKTIVDNWRVFAEVLKQIAVLLAAIKVAQYANAWNVVAGKIASATIASEGMVLRLSSLRKILISLKTTMMGHPLLLIGTLVASGVSALIAYNDAIEETNKKYDEASTKELRKRDNLLKINKEVEKNNAVLKDATKNEQELEKARRANENQLKLLKNDYPQINNYIKIQKDGTIDLTRAIEEQNNVLRANIALQQSSKRTAFQEDLSTNYGEVLEEFANFTRQVDKVNAKAYEMLAKIEAHKDKLSTEDYEAYKKLYEQMSKGRSTKWLSSLRSQAAKLGLLEGVPREVNELFMSIQDEILTVRSYAGDWNDALDDLYDNLDNGMSTFVVNIKRLYDELGQNANSDEFKKQGGKFITESLKNLGITDERTLKKLQEYIQQEVSKALNIKLNLDFSVDKGQGSGSLAAWAQRIKPEVERINAEIQKLHPKLDASKLFPVPDENTTWEQYENLANGIIEIGERTYQEGQKIFGELDIEQTNALKEHLQEFKNLLNISDSKKDGGVDETLQAYIDLIKLIKKAHEQYKEFKKTHDEKNAYRLTFEANTGLFDDIKKKLPDEFTNYELRDFNFGNERGVLGALEHLLDIIPDKARTAKIEVQKAIRDIKGEDETERKEAADKLLMNKFDKMFSDYEIGLELKELDIPSDWAKQFFNVDTIDLSSLKKDLQDTLASLGTEGAETLRTFLKNKINEVTELENKANKERLKTYLEYARESVGERAKIKLEEVKKLREIEETFGDDPNKKEVKEKAIEGVKKETQEKLDKFDWEEFKKSDTFIQLFSDLDNASSALIEHALNKLREFKNEWKNMPLEDVKEIVTKITQLEDALVGVKPLKEQRTIKREIKNAERNAIFTSDDAFKAQEKKDYETAFQIEAHHWDLQSKQWEKEKSQLETVLRLKEEGKSIDQVRNQLSNEEIELYGKNETQLRAALTNAEGMVKKTKENAQENQKNANLYAKQRNIYAEQAEQVKAIQEQASLLYGSFKDLYNILGGDEMGGMFADMGMQMMETVMNTIALQYQLHAATVAAEGFGAAMNTAMGVIGWIVMAINIIVQGLTAIFNAKDNQITEEIENMQEEVKRLEHEFQNLERTIDRAFSHEGLSSSVDDAQANIDARISSYEQMIALEQSRKKADQAQINEWKRTVEELKQEKDELEEEMITELGGSFDVKSVADQFAQAWMDAFKETGNGLKGLQEEFDDFLMNLIVQQMSLKVAGKYIDKVLDATNKALSDTKIDEWEAQQIQKAKDEAVEGMNKEMEELSKIPWMQDWINGSASNLSGLAEGIQGVTESTAQVIEAYLNSIRFFVAENNSYLKVIAEANGMSEEYPANPMLSELRSQTSILRSIESLFDSVIQRGGHGKYGGYFLKVAME